MPKSYDDDVQGYFRPVIRERFGSEFAHAAGTPGAPERPENVTGVVTTKNKNVLFEIQQDATECCLKGGHMAMINLALTNRGLIETAQAMSSTLIFQKFSPSIGLTRQYAEIVSKFQRDAFPGNIMSHLVRRDGQKDLGMTDGVRFMGNYYGNNVMRVNEKRPLLHPKLVIFLYPDKKGMLNPTVSWGGSANITENADFSFEEMYRSEDPKIVMANYLSFCHYYSVSEGLFNFSGGVVPTYWWESKAQSCKPPKCPSCKSSAVYAQWLRTEEHPHEHRKYLVCEDCKERIPYLSEHVVCP